MGREHVELILHLGRIAEVLGLWVREGLLLLVLVHVLVLEVLLLLMLLHLLHLLLLLLHLLLWLNVCVQIAHAYRRHRVLNAEIDVDVAGSLFYVRVGSGAVS